jgi:hypothetical protein
MFQYKPEILAQLLDHGIRPAPATRPASVSGYVSDLYRYELRRLKERLRRKEFPQQEYYARVVELRLRYPLVSLPVHLWTVPGTPAERDDAPLC